MDIFEVLRRRGFETAPGAFYGEIENWRSWYRGDVKRFHHYRVFNGQKHVPCRRYALGMAKKICEDWADLLMNEKVRITLEGQREQAFVDRVLEENNFRVMANEMQEWKAALGTAAYVLRLKGAEADADSGEITGARGIGIDYVKADGIIPLSWENGEISECAFAAEKSAGGENLVYVQIHRLNGEGEYDIENLLLRDRGGDLSELEPGQAAGFEALPRLVHTGSRERQFVIDRMNIANNAWDGPMGISVFANAIDQLKGVDVAYDSYVNEFALGKKRIMVQPEATKNLDGEPLFDQDDLAFYVLPEDRGGESLIKEIDMHLRTQEHNAALQDMLNMLSAKCGLGEGRYRYDRGEVATATEVISENSAMFRTMKKHEIVLEKALKELCRAILRLGNTAMGAGLDEEVPISIDFDDSVIEDKETEFEREARMLELGILKPYEFRMKWMNEDEDTARAALGEVGSK